MEAYQKLETIFKEISLINQIQSMLFWDSAVMMPIKSSYSRSEQLAYLAKTAHEKIINPLVTTLLWEALDNQNSLNEWQKANLQLIKRNVNYATALPSDLVEALSKATSNCEVKWREARTQSNFNLVKKELEEVVNLTRQKADAFAAKLNLQPYEALIDIHDPHRKTAELDHYFKTLSEFLPGFIDNVIEKQGSKPTHKFKFAKNIQEKLSKQYLQKLHFDFERGRLDESTHPFCGGIPEDSRITTRYNENNFSDSFLGVVHESGHSLYERNLPKQWVMQPVGHACGFAIHESQSLFIEKQICKSKPFLKHLYSNVIKEFQIDEILYSFDNFDKQLSFVERSHIRVDADEATYPLHIIIRYNLEKTLINKQLEVKDLPGAFNEQMEKLLKIKPQNDSQGCLQDIHWHMGAFGYFPSYTIGAMTAAQIMAKIRGAINNIEQLLETCELDPILKWLNNNIHAHGSKYTPNELTKLATGEELNPKYFIEHLKIRY